MSETEQDKEICLFYELKTNGKTEWTCMLWGHLCEIFQTDDLGDIATFPKKIPAPDMQGIFYVHVVRNQKLTRLGLLPLEWRDISEQAPKQTMSVTDEVGFWLPTKTKIGMRNDLFFPLPSAVEKTPSLGRDILFVGAQVGHDGMAIGLIWLIEAKDLKEAMLLLLGVVGEHVPIRVEICCPVRRISSEQ